MHTNKDIAQKKCIWTGGLSAEAKMDKTDRQVTFYEPLSLKYKAGAISDSRNRVYPLDTHERCIDKQIHENLIIKYLLLVISNGSPATMLCIMITLTAKCQS